MSSQERPPQLTALVEKYMRDKGVSDPVAFAEVTKVGEGAVLLQKMEQDRRDPSEVQLAKNIAMIRKHGAAEQAERERVAKRMKLEKMREDRQAAIDTVTAKVDAAATKLIADAYAKGLDLSITQARNQVYLSPEGAKLFAEQRRLETEDSLERSTAVSSGPGRAIRS